MLIGDETIETYCAHRGRDDAHRLRGRAHGGREAHRGRGDAHYI